MVWSHIVWCFSPGLVQWLSVLSDQILSIIVAYFNPDVVLHC